MREVTVRKYSDELYHYGIKGQQWGRRRYQNEDGSYTPEGKRRYAEKGSLYRRGEGLNSGKAGNSRYGNSAPGANPHHASWVGFYNSSNGKIDWKKPHLSANEKRYDPFKKWETTTGTGKSQFQTTAAGTSSADELHLMPEPTGENKNLSDEELYRRYKKRLLNSTNKELDQLAADFKEFTEQYVSEVKYSPKMSKWEKTTTIAKAKLEQYMVSGTVEATKAVGNLVNAGMNFLTKSGLLNVKMSKETRRAVKDFLQIDPDTSKEGIVARRKKQRKELYN